MTLLLGCIPTIPRRSCRHCLGRWEKPETTIAARVFGHQHRRPKIALCPDSWSLTRKVRLLCRLLSLRARHHYPRSSHTGPSPGRRPTAGPAPVAGRSSPRTAPTQCMAGTRVSEDYPRRVNAGPRYLSSVLFVSWLSPWKNLCNTSRLLCLVPDDLRSPIGACGSGMWMGRADGRRSQFNRLGLMWPRH